MDRHVYSVYFTAQDNLLRLWSMYMHNAEYLQPEYACPTPTKSFATRHYTSPAGVASAGAGEEKNTIQAGVSHQCDP